jgi:hypothetical protein
MMNDYFRIKYELKKYLRNQILRKYKNLEYNSPNYWEIDWLKNYFKANKIRKDIQKKLVEDLGFLPPYDFL